MTALQNVGSAAIGAVTSLEVLAASNPTPSTKDQLVSILSAALIQVLLFGLAELKKLREKKKRKKEQPEPVEAGHDNS